MATLLSLPVKATNPFSVKVANGTMLHCHERFNEVQITIQGTNFSLTLYSLPLTGLDLVLEIQWLENLGSVMCNWKTLTMDFVWQNFHHGLTGIDGHQIEVASLRQLSKHAQPRETMLAICVQQSATLPAISTPPKLQDIISSFVEIF